MYLFLLSSFSSRIFNFQIFYWNTVDLLIQCCVSFRCKAKWFSYVCVCVYIYIYVQIWIKWKVKVLVTQSFLTLCDSMDCIAHWAPLSMELWVAISFSRGSSQPRDWTLVSCIAGRLFTDWATRETCKYISLCVYIYYIYVCVCVYHYDNIYIMLSQITLITL